MLDPTGYLKDEEINEVEEFDTDYTRDITCPYCGYENNDSWEVFGPNDGDGDVTETSCGRCDKEFTVQLNVRVTYSTEKKKEVQDGSSREESSKEAL